MNINSLPVKQTLLSAQIGNCPVFLSRTRNLCQTRKVFRYYKYLEWKSLFITEWAPTIKCLVQFYGSVATFKD